jgi:hypothetical protein
MITCVCINDSNRPSKIPEHKWLVQDLEYTLFFAIVVLPQRQLAFQLQEIDLDDSCAPYEYFLASRFAFSIDDLEKLNEFVQDCTNITLSVKELMKETNVSI